MIMRHGLTAKFFLMSSSIVLLLTLFYTLFLFRLHITQLEKEIRERAENVAKNLAEKGSYFLYFEDKDGLQGFLQQAKSPELLYARYIKDDIVLAEMGNPPKPLSVWKAPTESHRWSRHSDFLEVIYPVTWAMRRTEMHPQNEPEMPVRETIGYVHLYFSLETLQKVRSREIRALWMIGTFGFLLGILLTLIQFLSTVRPIQSLTSAVIRFREGKTQPLPARSKDEIGILIREFNRMTEEITRAKEELEATLSKLEEANQVKSEFLAHISHELKTPLHSIIGFTQLLLEGGEGSLSEEQKEDLTIILDSSRHLHQLISQVLDFSRIEAGREEFLSQPVVLGPLLEECHQTFRAQAEKKGLKFYLQVAPDLLTVVADKVKLRQVISNLLSNAIKYTPEGEVILGAKKTEIDVVFWVRDTGLGVPEEQREKIFEPFYQIVREEELEGATKGTGLGLSIAKKYVEHMGGEIWVTSAEPRGSIFYVKLPSGGEGNGENLGRGR